MNNIDWLLFYYYSDDDDDDGGLLENELPSKPIDSPKSCTTA